MLASPVLNESSLPFVAIKVRVAAVVFAGSDIALLRRDRPSGPHYTLPGGNIVPGEDFRAGLARELAEELQLDLAHATNPELLWMQDQRITRPGAFRKLHFIYRCHITPERIPELATEERETSPDGDVQVSKIEWIDYRKAADIPLYPAVGSGLSSLPSPDALSGCVDLVPMTDANYTWM